MELINTGQVDTLTLWEISRAARDRPVHAALLAACVENGVWLGVNGRLHDPNDPDDGFMLDLGGALAVRESSMTSKRTRRDVETRALLGRPHGSLPYGYRRILDPVTGKTIAREIDPEQGPIVAEIARRLLAREPARAIAADLNTRGVLTKTGKQWRGGNLSILVLRPTYASLRVLHGEVLDGVTATWPPIISELDHHRLVAMFADPERDKFRNSTHVRHLGTGLFRCGREGCDGRMRAAVQEGRPNRYDCRECHKISRHQDPVDNAVGRLLIGRLSMPDALAAFAPGDDSDVREAAAEAARLRSKLDEARAAWDADKISLESFADLERRTLPKIKAAEERARPKHLPAVVQQMAGEHAVQRWMEASIKERRTVLDALVEITILPVGRGGRPFDPSGLGVRWKTG